MGGLYGLRNSVVHICDADDAELLTSAPGIPGSDCGHKGLFAGKFYLTLRQFFEECSDRAGCGDVVECAEFRKKYFGVGSVDATKEPIDESPLAVCENARDLVVLHPEGKADIWL